MRFAGIASSQYQLALQERGGLPVVVGKTTASCCPSFDDRANVSLSVQTPDPEFHSRIESVYDPFFTTKSGGGGLGLAICSTMIANYGGNLRLLRTGPHGSVFEVILPSGAIVGWSRRRETASRSSKS